MVQSLTCPPVVIGCLPKVSIVSGVQVNTTDKDFAVIIVHLRKHAEGEGWRGRETREEGGREEEIEKREEGEEGNREGGEREEERK